MPGPYRKVERITVHNEPQLWSVLRLAALVGPEFDVNPMHDRLNKVGSWHNARCSIFKDIGSVYTIFYTPGELDMRSTSKTILYTITGTGATSKKVPVGIFATEDKCRPYAVHVMKLHKAGDATAIKELGLPHLITESGEVAQGLRFQRLTLPYDPQFGESDVDPFADSKTDAS